MLDFIAHRVAPVRVLIYTDMQKTLISASFAAYE